MATCARISNLPCTLKGQASGLALLFVHQNGNKMRNLPEPSRMVITMLYERYRRAREQRAAIAADMGTKDIAKNMAIASETEAWNALQSARQMFYGQNESLPRDAEGAHAFLKIIGLRGLIKKHKVGNRKAR